MSHRTFLYFSRIRNGFMSFLFVFRNCDTPTALALGPWLATAGAWLATAGDQSHPRINHANRSIQSSLRREIIVTGANSVRQSIADNTTPIIYKAQVKIGVHCLMATTASRLSQPVLTPPPFPACLSLASDVVAPPSYPYTPPCGQAPPPTGQQRTTGARTPGQSRWTAACRAL